MFVYFIKSGSGSKPPIKIGISSSLEKRVETLQVGNPESITLIASISCKSRLEAHKLESYLHNQLKKRRLRGEWFCTSMKRINQEVNRYFSSKKINKVEG